MNGLRRIGAIVLSIMMIAACITAWADGDAEGGDTANDGIAGNTNGVWATADAPVVQGRVVTIYKEIVAYNPEISTINAPTITYEYIIAAGSSGKDIYDDKGNHVSADNAHVQTKAGIGTPVITTSTNGSTFTEATDTDHNKLKITPAITMNADNDGESNKYKIHIDFTGVPFNAAGVYRYEITETATNYVSSGVKDGTISNTRYLDVYVKDGTPSGNTPTYDVYGYVCFTYDKSIDNRETSVAASDSTVEKAVKTEGFVAHTDTSGTSPVANSADEYYTYNLTIKKNLVNDQAQNSNEFPFKITFDNSIVTDNVLPQITQTGTSTAPTSLTAADAKAISSFEFDGTVTGTDAGKKVVKIAHNGTVTFTGIPIGTKVKIDEYNNVTGTTYRVSTSNATENETGLNLNWSAWAGSDNAWGDSVNGTGYVYVTAGAIDNTFTPQTFTPATGNFTRNNTIIFTNTLLQISPTGIVTRYAPYGLILVAGVVLLVISKKRKKNTDEE